MPAHRLTPSQKIAIGLYRARLGMMHALSVEWAGARALDIFSKPYPGSKLKDPPSFRIAEQLVLQSGDFLIRGYRWPAETPCPKRFLIVHGFSGNSRKFEAYIEPARLKGYDVYAFDAPAHGKSTGNRLNGHNYLQVLRDIIAAYGHFDAYLGHSLGGLVIMLDLDELITEKPQKVMLVAPATESLTAAELFFNFLRLPETIREAFKERVIEITGHGLDWFSISRVLPRSSAEILWIHDEDDLTTPMKDVLPVLASTPPQVTFYFTRGLGHSGIYRDNHVINQVINFL